MRTTLAVYLGIIYSYLPFMVLPLFATLEKLDTRCWRRRRPGQYAVARVPRHHPAAVDARGDRRLDAGVHPGGRRVRHSLAARRPDNLMIGRVLWDEFFGNHDWPVASAVAIAFLVLLVGPIALYQYYNVRSSRPEGALETAPPRPDVTVLCFRHRDPLPADPGADRLFLQRLPAGQRLGRLLDRLVRQLLHNRQLLEAALLSLEVGIAASTGAVVLGTLAAIALVRFGAFPAGCC
jgi:hypothetical protein